MPKFVVKNNPLEGEYEWNLEQRFTNGEHRLIKRLSGVRVGEYDEALKAGDMDFLTALFAVAMNRAGKQYDEAQLWNIADGDLILDTTGDAIEADADPTPRVTEPSRYAESEPSGPHSSASTESSLATSTGELSGIPQQVSGSARLTSTT